MYMESRIMIELFFYLTEAIKIQWNWINIKFLPTFRLKLNGMLHFAKEISVVIEL